MGITVLPPKAISLSGTPGGGGVGLANTEITVYQSVETRDETGAISTSWTNVKTIYAAIQERSPGSRVRVEHGRYKLPVTHSLYTQTDPGALEGYRASWTKNGKTVYALVQGQVDQAGKNTWWRIDCTVDL